MAENLANLAKNLSQNEKKSRDKGENSANLSKNSVQNAKNSAKITLNNPQGFVLLISGPSGAGKSTLLARLTSEFKDELYFSVSCTTRAAREGERDGVDYHFISENAFKMGIERGEFLEYAFVHSNFYGTRAKETEQALNAGKVVVFDIDVQGFRQVRERLKGLLTSVFITTKSAQELENRLRKRASNDDIKKRLENAKSEMKALAEYDFLVINEDLAAAYAQLKSIFVAQKLRISRYNAEQISQLWKGV